MTDSTKACAAADAIRWEAIRRAALIIFSAVLVARLASAAAKHAAVTTPRWTRPLLETASYPNARVPVMQPLPDGSLLVRNGAGVLAIDARGVVRWSMPNVDDAMPHGDAVVFRRPNVIFAVRARDAGMLWKRLCGKPSYFVAAGDRIVTICDEYSTVLRARDGAVLARRAARIDTSPPALRGARPLNDGYVLVMNTFDGAWLGEAYYVVDARTGAFLWSQTDCDVVDVTRTTIALVPYPSMLPWGSTGEVVRRRLSDGAKLDTQTYAPPKEADPDRRGNLVMSRTAAYVAVNGTLFRLRRGHPSQPQRLRSAQRLTTLTLGDAAFILTQDPMRRDGDLYLDRPSGRGGFVTRALGRYIGYVSIRGPGSSEHYVAPSEAVHLGDRIAIPYNDVVRLYDQFGKIEMTAKSRCTRPQLAATRTTFFMRCGEPGKAVSLTAFPRP